jgi:alpha-D-ribose 1-methylphosphonate 5-triphosphate synthase subunit PhnG
MTTSPQQHARRDWMALLARTDESALRALVAPDGELPAYTLPRPPEVGLCMVRGRMGGTGRPFNLGEMTLTRCVVQLPDATAGVAYIAGRDPQRAELAALADALLQCGRVERAVLDPLRAAIEARRSARADAVAATRVDFFTLVRGED